MPLLLHIDTATEHASVCISKGSNVLELTESREQKNHAGFVQPAIEYLVNKTGFSLAGFDAISVTAGPGSYTGLRVGLASAKGICYALQKPLILINTLEVMAQAILSYHEAVSEPLNPLSFLCPLIDARRMEVFTATYDTSLQQISPPYAAILEEDSFSQLLDKQPVIFSGSGMQKLKNLLSNKQAVYCPVQHNATDLAKRALIAYQSGSFADLAYAVPLYVKEFFNPSSKQND